MEKNFNTNNQEQKNIYNITTTEGETIMNMNGTKVIKVICYWVDAFANVAGKYGNYTDHIRIQCEKYEDAIKTAKKILEEYPGCDDVEIDTLVRGIGEDGKMDRFFLPEAEHVKRETQEQEQEQEQEQAQETETETETNTKEDTTDTEEEKKDNDEINIYYEDYEETPGIKEIILKDRDGFIDKLVKLIVGHIFEVRKFDIDICVYNNEKTGDWSLLDFVNPGGNHRWLSEYIKIWRVGQFDGIDEELKSLNLSEEEEREVMTDKYHEYFEENLDKYILRDRLNINVKWID